MVGERLFLLGCLRNQVNSQFPLKISNLGGWGVSKTKLLCRRAGTKLSELAEVAPPLHCTCSWPQHTTDGKEGRKAVRQVGRQAGRQEGKGGRL